MGTRKKILLTDDIELFLELERNFLQREDLDLLIAKDGCKALAMIREHNPEIAFLNLTMPGIDGLECCRQVKQDSSLAGTTLAMVVSAGRPDIADLCREAGCDKILFKPINHGEFLSMIRQCLELEVRAGSRLKAEIRVNYGPEPQQLLSEFSVDVSAGGLYLKTDFPLTTDEPLVLRFSLPKQQQMVSCKARVAWVNTKENPRNPNIPTGMGIQFVEISLEDLRSIRRFIEYNELEPVW